MEVNKIIHGDCLEVLKTLPDECIDCCVTSPPYYGLRDYGTAKWEGGTEDCSHIGKQLAGAPGSEKQNSNKGANYVSAGNCIKCGATRVDNQIGLEETPELFVAKMVEVFTEVKRVLKKDGTLWLNLGDSYASNTKGGGGPSQIGKYQDDIKFKPRKFNHGLKEKDLIGIPWMVAFALRSAGWYLRQDIIWHKPNPMPESVTDRCTKSHEYIFLLSKSQKYYYDAEAIKYEMLDISLQRNQTGWNGNEERSYTNGKQNHLSKYLGSDKAKEQILANKRSVWTVTTKPFSEAHFATFPEDLIVDCIKAGCPENGIVLDPFSGAGTTALVARKLYRNYIGIELNQQYIDIAEKRLQKELGMFI